MPLEQPRAPGELAGLPSKAIAGAVIHRVVLRDRTTPWWFASVPKGADETARRTRGRFDLPEPYGTCYWSTTPVGAILEAVQDFGRGLLPDVVLQARRRVEVLIPRRTRPAAWLTTGRARPFGVTQALWASQDRPLTQRWAAALHRAGWLSLYHGLQHDPTGRLRGITLFDHEGEHPPYDDPANWPHTTNDLHDDPALIAGLGRYGIRVTRSDPNFPVIPLEDSGLL